MPFVVQPIRNAFEAIGERLLDLRGDFCAGPASEFNDLQPTPCTTEQGAVFKKEIFSAE
jgi:hypothetical protein